VLTGLAESLRATSAEGRLGTLVALRLIVAAPAPEVPGEALAGLIHWASACLNLTPARLCVVGSGASLAATVSYPEGETALIALSRGRPGARLILLGNRGAAYHESGEPSPAAGPPPAAPSGSNLPAAVRESLQSGRPVDL